MPDTQHTLSSTGLTATISALGAELTSLKTTSGQSLLWNAGPEWQRHSPVLFPIIGKAPENTTLNGKPLALHQHGFARDMPFRWITRSNTECTLELRDSAETRALFPAAFQLRLTYTLTENTLTVTYSLTNPSPSETLHASLGVHPAFTWPLLPGTDRESYSLTFEKPEGPVTHRITSEGLLPETFPSPLQNQTLPLTDSLFEHDAIIMLNVNSRSLTFTTPDQHGLKFEWTSFPDLGLWTKPGAEFLCIEPWAGYTTPVGFSGDFTKKPGLLHLKPAESWEGSWQVTPI